MEAMHIYQFLNHYTRREELDPGFGVLDNSAFFLNVFEHGDAEHPGLKDVPRRVRPTVRVLKSYRQNGR